MGVGLSHYTLGTNASPVAVAFAVSFVIVHARIVICSSKSNDCPCMEKLHNHIGE